MTGFKTTDKPGLAATAQADRMSQFPVQLILKRGRGWGWGLLSSLHCFLKYVDQHSWRVFATFHVVFFIYFLFFIFCAIPPRSSLMWAEVVTRYTL